ncbi:hypothetical protein DL991_21550 [Amycolatopsis sp. WAC 01375]|nr:hypothetical protein DL991_21550 [Amycolatopsis sp. WAC 01375]
MHRRVEPGENRPDAGVGHVVPHGATWCPPCRQMTPVIERLAGEYGGRFLLGEVDVDQSRAWIDAQPAKG